MALFSHADKLRDLDASAPLLEKIDMLRRILQARALPIDRVAVATYDPEGDVLHTFIASNDGENPLVRYESRLADAPSLLEVREKRAPRVVNDLALFAAGSHTHTHSISAGGFRASYTVPIFAGDRFVGFVFFNSRQAGVFDEPLLDQLDRLIRNFELDALQGIDSLRDVALMHHEALDGSGYPRGLSHDEIPMMARIVAVADIFDALTSPRSYKRPWPVDEAMTELRRMAVSKLDPECVNALAARLSDAERIRLEFAEAAAEERISVDCGNLAVIP